ncbi:hypothetical protein AGMMS50239_39150 [Bacteroidia bacterium]|nr:hypothetical protein AGMMS50239_39150 [Bacteroidia bacterium]
MSDLYVPDNSFIFCDKGTSPGRLKATHHHNTKLYGEYLACEADMIFGENIPPLGVCSITRSPCSLQPVYWDKTAKHVKVNGYKLLFQDACLLCKQGGKISIEFSVTDTIKALSILNNGVKGGFWGRELGASFLNNNFANIASELRGVNTTLLPNTTQQGNYGEIRTVQDFKIKGYQIISNSQATSVQGGGHQGLDIAAYDPKSGTDIIIDSKYKTNAGKKPTMSTTKGSGKQMSDRWLIQQKRNGAPSRIEQAMSAEDAARVRNKIKTNSSDLTRAASKVEPNGNITHYEVDANGKVLNPVEIPPANIVKGTSKAANLINDVSHSIQTNRTIASINKAIVENADEIAKVGKVAGRAAIVVGILLDAISIYGAYQEDGGRVGTNTKQAIGSAAGALAGGLAGAKVGALIGAVGGPVGVIVGGIVGGIIGGILGGLAGKGLGSLF